MTDSFDWALMMQAGVYGLRLKPVEFWDLTPAEFKLMLGQSSANAPLNRNRLDALIEAFPDVAKERIDERSRSD